MLIYVSVTHTDGETDLGEVHVPLSASDSAVRTEVSHTYGHLFCDGDVVDLTLEDERVPYDSFTV